MNATPSQSISDLAQLEDILSQPTPGLIELFKNLAGDILVLGAAGKMGPTLSRMAKRQRCGRAIAKDYRRRAGFPIAARRPSSNRSASRRSRRICSMSAARHASRGGECHLHGRHEIRRDRRRAAYLGDEHAAPRDGLPKVRQKQNRRVFDRQCVRPLAGRARRKRRTIRSRPSAITR